MDSQFSGMLFETDPAPTLALPRILLVDDEPIVRQVTLSILRRANFAVTQAGSGEEAIAKLQAGSFELIVTDYNMGKLNGADVAIAARHVCPDTPVVLMTGLIHDVPDWMCRGNLALPILRKPFLMSELLQVVKRALPVQASSPEAQVGAVPA
jgi:two-component system response regulator AtoC